MSDQIVTQEENETKTHLRVLLPLLERIGEGAAAGYVGFDDEVEQFTEVGWSTVRAAGTLTRNCAAQRQLCNHLSVLGIKDRTMRKPARRGPPPQTEIARRLEEVRTRAGYPSLRSFHHRLAEGWANPLSYEAARNYHYDSKTVPANYLARVAEVFPEHCTSEWLLSGKGSPSQPDAEVDAVASAATAELLGGGLLELVRAGPDASEGGTRRAGSLGEGTPYWLAGLAQVRRRLMAVGERGARRVRRLRCRPDARVIRLGG